MATHEITMTVNGENRSAAVESRTLLSTFLRENLRLTGTHIGCDTSQCGTCVVHLNGESIKSCSLFAVQADGQDVKTIEAVADGETLHPMQQAFKDNHGLQCGFCTPGMIMAALDIVRRIPRPQRAAGSRRARRQHVSLHRLSQHRQVDPRRR